MVWAPEEPSQPPFCPSPKTQVQVAPAVASAWASGFENGPFAEPTPGAWTEQFTGFCRTGCLGFWAFWASRAVKPELETSLETNKSLKP